MRPHKPTAASAVAFLALFVALSGTAVASHYLITSTSQIKPSVLNKLRGHAGAQGPAGPAGAGGAPGPAGPAGPQGPAGPSNLSALTTVIGPTVEVEAGKVGGAEAVCPAGSHAVSGGGFGNIAGIAATEMETSHTSWFIVIANKTAITLKINASVECATSGRAVAADAPRTRITHARFDQRIAELAAQVGASSR